MKPRGAGAAILPLPAPRSGRTRAAWGAASAAIVGMPRKIPGANPGARPVRQGQTPAPAATQKSATRTRRAAPVAAPSAPPPAAKDAQVITALRAQPHGGALRTGGTNRGGPGRPPSAIRAAAQRAWDERLPILEAIADGQAVPVQKVVSTEAGPAVVEHWVYPAHRDRIAALAELRAVAFGTKVEVSGEDGGAVEFTITMGKHIVPPGSEGAGAD